MNITDAAIITAPIGRSPSFPSMTAEDAIFEAVISRWPLGSIDLLSRAIGAGKEHFEEHGDINAAIKAACVVMGGG